MASSFRALPLSLLLIVAACSGWDSSCGRSTPAGAGAAARGGEIVASLRSEPPRYNRYVDREAAAETLSLLTHGTLARVNRATDELEPWLAESWTSEPDGLTHTVKLRRGVRFSDGAPFTSADVVFSFRALYDEDVHSSLATALSAGGKPLEVSAPDAHTVVVRFPVPFAPGLRLLDRLPILPRHKLEAALNERRFADAWKVGTPLGEIAGLGPFVLSEHVSGLRLVFTRNPHYWRKDAAGVPLPYLDRITLLLIPDQNAEALRVESGEVDLMVNGDIRPEDYAAFKRAAGQGRLQLVDVGTGLDPNMLWFNLSPSRAAAKPWLHQRAFRQAVSYAADRQAIVNAAFLGEGVPVHGPISPGNRTWYSDAIPKYDHDPAKAQELLASIGLIDRNGDGVLEDDRGGPVRFSLLTQRGHIRERIASMLQEQLRQAGMVVDVVGLDPQSIQRRVGAGDYDSVYFGFQSSSTDPALNAEFWLSSGVYHIWNPEQRTPATEWERRVDDLVRQHIEQRDVTERKRLIAEAQRILGEELPAIFFVAPKVVLAVSTRVTNTTPALLTPQLLWAADTLAVTGPPPRPGS
jgi:peptide/nickel transport system substrate-binding protein